MTLHVYTGRLGRFKDDDALDITRGSGCEGKGLIFAPSLKLFYSYTMAKHAGHAEAEWPTYRETYIEEMKNSRVLDPMPWIDLLGRTRVVLICYCENILRCHRYILGATILPEMGAIYEGEIVDDR